MKTFSFLIETVIDNDLHLDSELLDNINEAFGIILTGDSREYKKIALDIKLLLIMSAFLPLEI